MSKQIITQERLKEIFHYDPDTGVFTWKVAKATHTRIGDQIKSTSSKGYVSVGIDGVYYKCHRLAWLYMTGSFPEGVIDHINQNKSDNRFHNLRDVTNQENLRNASLYKPNKSGVHGVRWHEDRKKYRAYIRVNGHLIHLGSHSDRFDAICARKAAEFKHNFHPNHGS